MRINPSRRNRAMLAILAALLAERADAVETLPIRLVDVSGAGVAHAQVGVVGRTGSVRTDGDGVFQLNPEPPTPFEIAVFDEDGSWLGRIRVEQLADEGVRELVLPPVETVEVYVTGGVAPATISPPAAAATVVSRAEIARQQPDRLVDITREVPGAARGGAGQAAVPSLRGMAQGRTLLLLDDGRVSTERRAGASATYLDPFSLAHIELVRGPGSVAYGSDAMGGIIHARTPAPSADRFSGRYEGWVATGQDGEGGGVELNVPAGPGALLFQLHRRSFESYESPEGTVPNSESRDRGALLKWSTPAGASRWLFGVQADQSRDVGKPRIDPTSTRTFYPEETSYRLTASADLPAGGGFSAVDLTLFAGSYRLITERDDPQGSVAGNRSIDRSDVDANDAGARLIATRPTHRGLLRLGVDSSARLGLSANGSTTVFDASGQVVSSTSSESIESARRISLGLFAEGERAFGERGRTSVLVGLRGNASRTRNEGGMTGDRSGSAETLSGYLAGSFRIRERWTARIQAARGFREPLLSDLFYTGVTGRGFISGNPDLLPETSRQLDVSLERTGGVMHFAAYGYHYRISDLIERFRPDPALDVFAFRNRGRMDVRGVEVETDVSFGRFATRLALGHARGEIEDDRSAPSDVPGPTAILSVHHRPVDRVWWRMSYRYAFRDDRPGPTEIETPGYATLDASAGIRFRKEIELRFVLENVLDKTYPASQEDDAVPAPGRSASVVLAGAF